MSKFSEKYACPDAVKIDLEDVSFFVQLPTSANRKFERAIAASMTVRDPETGTFMVKAFTMADVFTCQHLAFIRSCIVRVEGLEFDPETFCDDYPDAAEKLYTIATTKANEVESEAASAVGKSQITLPGLSSGTEEKSSTRGSLKEVG